MATTKLTGVLIKTGSIPTTALGGGVISASAQLATSLPVGTVSSSAQIDYNSITNKLSGVVSSSTQVAPLLPGGTVSASGQVDYNSITNKLSDVVSSSAQFNALSGTSASYASTASVANASTLTGATLASGVTASSLTSVGTLAGLTVTAPIAGSVTGSSGSTTGNAATATALQTSRNINGTAFNGTADITVTAAAGTLTGATLASGVTASSLTSVGTLGTLTVSGNLTVDTTTLFVDAANNRVGVGLTTPAETLDVKGTGNFNAVGGTYVGFSHNGTLAGYVGTANALITGGATTNFGILAQSALVFASGGATERMRLDSSGNLQLGTTTNKTTAFTGNGTGMTIGATLAPTIACWDTSDAGYVASMTQIGADMFLTNTANGIMVFNTNNTERARIPAAGGFQVVGAVSVGNATPVTSGAGITFPATQSASSNANTLDDYEEGTFTPVYEGQTGSIGATAYTVQHGSYTKIGNVVTVWAQIVLSNKGSWTGNVTLAGFPFTASASGGQNMGALWVENVTFADQINARIGPAESHGSCRINTSAGAGSYLDTTGVTNTSGFRLTITYLV